MAGPLAVGTESIVTPFSYERTHSHPSKCISEPFEAFAFLLAPVGFSVFPPQDQGSEEGEEHAERKDRHGRDETGDIVGSILWQGKVSGNQDTATAQGRVSPENERPETHRHRQRR